MSKTTSQPSTTQTQSSNHWVDKLSRGILSWQQKNTISKLHVDDMKTPSGRVHTGALRGVLLHDFIAKGLAQHTGQDIVSTYVFNDMDAMDGLPSYLDQAKYSQHMGKPLYKIPAPSLEESGIDFSQSTEAEKNEFRHAKNFAEFYATDFIKAIRKLGCSQEIIWSHELYESGKMDAVIRLVLDNVTKVRKVYEEVAEYSLPEKWYPFQVICPQCGKIGSVLVTDWDGKEVTYECKTNKVEWAVGCGHSGKMSPFGGSGKFTWKVDWPAHWSVLGVNVEGAGKDHTSAGGSRDMADALCPTVFQIPVPFDIPYEWILIRGAKMSSSKGVGTSAREFVELFPPEVGRFLFVNKLYSQVIDFDPQTMTIPDLYDDYDLGAQVYWEQQSEDLRMGRSFELSQLATPPQPHFLPRFRDVATWMQYPEIDLITKFSEIKGAPLTAQEIETLNQRKHYAQVWIDRYAPADFQLSMTKTVPSTAQSLSQEQKHYLQDIENLISSKASWDPQELQQAMYEEAKKTLGAKAGFEAIYLSFIGKKAGPRAAWFLLSLDPESRKERIANVTRI